MSELSKDELVEIRKLFERFDVDDNDTIDWEEFCKLVDDLQLDISLENRTKVFNIIDANNTGMISFEEFTEIWKKG